MSRLYSARGRGWRGTLGNQHDLADCAVLATIDGGTPYPYQHVGIVVLYINLINYGVFTHTYS